jgi:hypothetical protein
MIINELPPIPQFPQFPLTTLLDIFVSRNAATLATH